MLQENYISDINCLISDKTAQLNFQKEDLSFKKLEQNLQQSTTKEKIIKLHNHIEKELCSQLANAFWESKQHIITHPYKPDFDEKTIPTKARPSQMNQAVFEYCKKEIQDLFSKNLMRKSKSSWNCSAFYVYKNAEIERGVPRLVINYKPLNKALRRIRYLIPNKKDILARLYK